MTNMDKQLVADMTAWRRTIHSNPEMAFEEHDTARLVAEVLRANGIDVVTGVGRTGVVGTLRRGAGPSTGLRADMDALPLVEKNSFGHKSCRDGTMHACGHDGHTAMLLGAAVALSRDQDWKGTVHFIFQPAEESVGGGKVMVEDGLFERFPCDRVFGLHNWPGVPAGRFAINHGPMMASFDTFEITIQGVGGHAAMPEQAVDALVCASQLVLALQTIVSRRISAQDSAVVSVTQIHGGEAWNVLPDSAVVRGTVRCFSSTIQHRIQELLAEVAGGVAQSCGARATVSYRYGYPATVNTQAETDLAIKAASAVVGADNVTCDCVPGMGSEDFAFMLAKRPGAYIWMGVDQGSTVPLHNPHYDFNDEVISHGAAFWVQLAKLSGEGLNAKEEGGFGLTSAA